MLPVKVDLEAYRGDTWAQTFRLLNTDGSPVDVDTAELVVRGRSLSGTPEPTLVVAPTGEPGELVLGLGEGTEAGRYDYDVAVSQGGVTTTWVRGQLQVTGDIP